MTESQEQHEQDKKQAEALQQQLENLQSELSAVKASASQSQENLQQELQNLSGYNQQLAKMQYQAQEHTQSIHNQVAMLETMVTRKDEINKQLGQQLATAEQEMGLSEARLCEVKDKLHDFYQRNAQTLAMSTRDTIPQRSVSVVQRISSSQEDRKQIQDLEHQLDEANERYQMLRAEYAYYLNYINEQKRSMAEGSRKELDMLEQYYDDKIKSSKPLSILIPGLRGGATCSPTPDTTEADVPGEDQPVYQHNREKVTTVTYKAAKMTEEYNALQLQLEETFSGLEGHIQQLISMLQQRDFEKSILEMAVESFDEANILMKSELIKTLKTLDNLASDVMGMKGADTSDFHCLSPHALSRTQSESAIDGFTRLPEAEQKQIHSAIEKRLLQRTQPDAEKIPDSNTHRPDVLSSGSDDDSSLDSTDVHEEWAEDDPSFGDYPSFPESTQMQKISPPDSVEEAPQELKEPSTPE